MYIRQETEQHVEWMEREGCHSNLEDILLNLLEQSPNPPPAPSSPAGPPQPAAVSLPGGFGGWTILGVGPPVTEQQVPPIAAPYTMVPAHLSTQPGTVSQGQNLLNQWPANGVLTAAAVPPAAPSDPCSRVLQIPDSMTQYLHPIGVLNGVLVCDFAAPPINTPSPKKRKRHEHQDDEDRVYVKKPPNAFMLFLNEERPKVKAELINSSSAAVNAVVGERWKSLPKAQQAKYYEQAEEERMLHAQQHPQWSSKDNYAKKRRRIRRSACSTASAPTPVQEVQQASVPVCGTLHVPQENQTLPASQASSPPQQLRSPSFITETPAMGLSSAPSSTSSAAFAEPIEPESEATSLSKAGVELLSLSEDLDACLPAMQPQEPFFLLSDCHTEHEISSNTLVDASLSTLASSEAAPVQPTATLFSNPEEDLLSFLSQSEVDFLYSRL
ncbi:transcription factor 7-like 1 isoform X1 [Archocentrus centrarchus]|uniref:transcription factor 7-like 1 isoform X1 n=1 Tax=Archocentrus centrarchus TaxID=63155 RepID=UPI0011E9BDC5|nr:transcription factor 7-like 1 isoform X1 [Archocentrus centrarchus]